MSLEGRICVITGGASGIGRATAELFVAKRARVAVIDHKSRAGDYQADIADPDALRRVFTAICNEVGLPDVWVNNAGVSARIPAEKYPLEDAERLFTLNVSAVLHGMQLCAHAWMAAGRGGAIVNLASVFGMVADPLSAPYAASKGAVIQLTRTAAVEWAEKKIRVNAVAPGYTRTEMTAQTLDSIDGQKILERVPMKRAARPEEIAEAIVFLASDAASFITGHVLVADGGYTAL
jgi:NAD(P)-dependent dehydrogenase (short-subunit alcohol dehydrogenase family)